MQKVDADSPIWESVAHYLGALIANIVLLVSPERIFLGTRQHATLLLHPSPTSISFLFPHGISWCNIGGGIMMREAIYPGIRRKVIEYLHGYIDVGCCNSGLKVETVVIVLLVPRTGSRSDRRGCVREVHCSGDRGQRRRNAWRSSVRENRA